MASSFISTASKRVTDVRGFLREAAGGSLIKYVVEKGCKHLIYIPYQAVTEIDDSGNEVVTKQLFAISGAVHEWQSPDGKYKATVCIKDIIRKSEDGEYLNDGTCPFCDRVSDGWDIYRYRKEMEEANCKLSGEDRKKYLEKTLSSYSDERKAKDARTYMYVLVVKYRQSPDNNGVVIGSDGLPEYDLKVMKLSQSRVDKIQQQLANSGSELPGSEIIFEYPNTDDRRLQVSQSTMAPVFSNNMISTKYPNLINKINEDVSKFEWEGIEKAFPEWNGMTSMEAKKITDSMFEQWDRYKAELKVNPGAKYMEYIMATAATMPQLSGAAANTQVGQGVSGVVPSVATPMGGTAPSIEAPQIPNIPDVNAVFGSGAPGIQL